MRGVKKVEEQIKHSLVVNNRKKLVMQGVRHVDSFDESEIKLETNMGGLSIKGEGLHISQLNLETGDLTVEGFLTSFQYLDNKAKEKGKGILNKILR